MPDKSRGTGFQPVNSSENHGQDGRATTFVGPVKLVDWLLACPEKGYIVPIESETTDNL